MAAAAAVAHLQVVGGSCRPRSAAPWPGLAAIVGLMRVAHMLCAMCNRGLQRYLSWDSWEYTLHTGEARGLACCCCSRCACMSFAAHCSAKPQEQLCRCACDLKPGCIHTCSARAISPASPLLPPPLSSIHQVYRPQPWRARLPPRSLALAAAGCCRRPRSLPLAPPPSAPPRCTDLRLN